jgi:hypothetical protein
MLKNVRKQFKLFKHIHQYMGNQHQKLYLNKTYISKFIVLVILSFYDL